jgi:IS5 family transposase
MNRDLWRKVVGAVRSADRQVPRTGRRPVYTDALVLKMLLWCVWHDRPLSWACRREHYTTWFRPSQVPSISQFCRRVKTPRVERLLAAVNAYLVRRKTPLAVAILDGKPLPLRDLTQDREARRGYGAGRMQTGYKLHALAAPDGRLLRFSVHPLNVGEPNTARQLVADLPPQTVVLADANYDSSPLYEAVAERQSQLVTPLKGRARSASRLRQMSPARRRMLRLWVTAASLCRRLCRERGAVERIFSALTCFGGGLGPLPSWVRRLDRVRRWVTAKIAIYHARLCCRQAVKG